MSRSIATPRKAHAAVNVVIIVLTTRRPALPLPRLEVLMLSPKTLSPRHAASAARDAPDEKARGAVDDEGHEEEHEAQLDERAQVQVARRLRELVGDDGGDGVARLEERGGDDGPVAYHHRHGHRLADRAPESEYDRARYPRRAVRE